MHVTSISLSNTGVMLHGDFSLPQQHLSDRPQSILNILFKAKPPVKSKIVFRKAMFKSHLFKAKQNRKVQDNYIISLCDTIS